MSQIDFGETHCLWVPREHTKGDLVKCTLPDNKNLGIVLLPRKYDGSRFRTYEVYVQGHGKLLLRHTEFESVLQKRSTC